MEVTKKDNRDSHKKEKKSTLTVIDNRTGASVEIPVQENGTISAMSLRNIKISKDDFGLMSYDPGYMNTACCTSKITFIDGDKGILQYRGYPIEQLAEQSTFLEVAYLLIYGNLPDKDHLEQWNTKIINHTYIHENLVQLMKSFRYDAHPMGMVISTVSAMSTFYPEANPALQGHDIYQNESLRNKQIFRILGKMPTIAACAYRHRIGRPYNNPVNHLSYIDNFLYMLDRLSESSYKPHPVLSKALEKLFILHADHELNCSTATMRQLTSSLVDPYTAVAGAAGALYGPLHGGANEAVLAMLQEIGTVDKVSHFLEEVKAKRKKLFGFGHRVYKNYDPRARILKEVTKEVFDVLGKSPLMQVAVELEQRALKDEYFISRKLYPNVDFYSGLIYKAMGFPTDMFPVLFAIPRTAGWLAHWCEMLQDSEIRIWRPRQVYTGYRDMTYVSPDDRTPDTHELNSYMSEHAKRRAVATISYDDPAPTNDEYNTPKTVKIPQPQVTPAKRLDESFGPQDPRKK